MIALQNISKGRVVTMKRMFCIVIACLCVFLHPICAVAKDTGICNTGNELFYHSLVGQGSKIGLPIEAFSRLSKQANHLNGECHIFRYPDRNTLDTVHVALKANKYGYTETIAIQYELNRNEAPATATAMLAFCMKSCFITDIEYENIFRRIANRQFDSYEGSHNVFTGTLSFYSSVNKKMLYITILRTNNTVFFILSSYPEN